MYINVHNYFDVTYSRCNYTFIKMQKENVAVKITFLGNDISLGKNDSTCQIYAAAMILKIRLMHYMLNEVITANVSVNIIRLFEEILTSLESIVTIQWQIYVRK